LALNETSPGAQRDELAAASRRPRVAENLIRASMTNVDIWRAIERLAGLHKARHRGLPKVDWQFTFAMAAYNPVHLPKLLKAVT
jgi:hypothetical protein